MFVLNGDVHITHSLGFDKALFFRRIVSQIDDRINAQSLEGRKVFLFGTAAPIKALVHLAKVTNLYRSEFRVRMGLGNCRRSKSKNEGRDYSNLRGGIF